MFRYFIINFYKSRAMGRKKKLFSGACAAISRMGNYDAAFALLDIFFNKNGITEDQKREAAARLSGFEGTVLEAMIKFKSEFVKAYHYFIPVFPRTEAAADFISQLGISAESEDLIGYYAETGYAKMFDAIAGIAVSPVHPARFSAMMAIARIDKNRSAIILKRILVSGSDIQSIRSAAAVLLNSGIYMNDEEYVTCLAVSGRVEEASEKREVFVKIIKKMFPVMDKRSKLDVISFSGSVKDFIFITENSLNSEDAEIRAFACRSYVLHPSHDKSKIAAMLNDSDQSVRKIAEKIILSDSDSYIPLLVSIIDTSVESGISLFYLTNIENILISMGKKIIESVKPLLNKNNSASLLAAEILSEIEDDSVTDVMLSLAGNGDPSIRQLAIEFLGNLKNPEFFELITGYLFDANPQIRKTAYDSLILSDISRAEILFRGMTTDLESDDRIYIKNILSEISRVN